MLVSLWLVGLVEVFVLVVFVCGRASIVVWFACVICGNFIVGCCGF